MKYTYSFVFGTIIAIVLGLLLDRSAIEAAILGIAYQCRRHGWHLLFPADWMIKWLKG